jgi:hypothetical protein
MARTRTLYVNLRRLALRPQEAGIILRLMMVCNDMALANSRLGAATEGRDGVPEHLAWGSKMYAIRLQIGHLNEAMPIFEDLRNCDALMAVVESCTQYARDCFAEVTSCLKGGANHKLFIKRIGIVRHKTVFHYDHDLVVEALKDRANTAKQPQSLTVSNDVRQMRYGVADAILDTLTVRHIWKLRDADINDKLDEVLAFGERLHRASVEFGQEFIVRYIRQNAAL